MKLLAGRGSRLFPARLLPCLAFILVAGQHAGASDVASYVVAKNVMVPMRDGVRLATDIYFPAQDGVRLAGKFPAILERTPYNKDESIGYLLPFVKHGYVVVTQDTRGRYASEGVWHMMTDDVNDGYDTAQWLVHQSWSDGGFGMIGTSYVGGTQHAMAESDPPGLKALIPVDAVSNAGYFGMRNGGSLRATISIRATLSPPSVGTFHPAMAFCFRAPGTSAVARPYGTVPTTSHFPRGAMCWCS
jgi:hypothetical protein